MALKIIKYLIYTLAGIIILVALIATPLIIKARSEGQRMYEKYDRYTEDVLAQSLPLAPYPIREEYRIVHPWKGLKLLRFAIEAWQTDKFKRINNLDASLMIFMKMYTLLILPNYNYNLPMLSVDIIFMGGKRVFVIELIDPAGIRDDNLEAGYAKMRSLKPAEGTLEKMEVSMEWAEDAVRDVSIHSRADRARDDLLFDTSTRHISTPISIWPGMRSRWAPKRAGRSRPAWSGTLTPSLPRAVRRSMSSRPSSDLRSKRNTSAR